LREEGSSVRESNSEREQRATATPRVASRQFTIAPVAIISDTANLTDPVWDNADRFPDEPAFALREGGSWHDITWARFRDEVVAVARGLIAAGVQPGERVALMSRTRYEWTLVDFAIWAAGAVTVPIYETSSPEQVQWILGDSGAVACVVETDTHLAYVLAVRESTPDLRHIWQIAPTDAAPGAVAELTELGASVPELAVAQRRAGGRADDLATMIYTSGTTGRPKGCMISHRNLASDINNALPGLAEFFHPGASTVLFLPLAHSFARLIQVGVVTARVRTTHLSDTRELVPVLGSFQPTFVLAVPRVFEKVFNNARQRAHADGKGKIFDSAADTAIAYSEARDRPSGPGLGLRFRHAFYDRLVYRRLRAALGGRCQAAMSGGAPLGPRLAHFFRGIGVTIFEGYGLTETSPAAAVNLRGSFRIGTVGRPLPGVSIRIADDGEIQIKGDIVFLGYWHNDAATAEVLSPDGWFATGDLGELDADGFLSITGRKKELIVTAGGKNVAPAVLEDRVRAHALVSQCMVIGDRQPFIAALVTLDEEALPAWAAAHGKAGLTLDQLRADADVRAEIQSAIDEANKAVSKAEWIRVFRILPSDFTEANGMLTPSLKVKRGVVAKEYADEIAAIYH
jgi:long-chain acyl-CoA synthetase